MKVLGTSVSVDHGAYVAGFSLVEDDQLLTEFAVSAPKDVVEAGQLAELHARTLDMVAEHQPDRVAFAVNELRAASKAAVANHAEGAILAALGTSGHLVDLWTGPRLRAKSGYAKGGGSSAKARAKLTRNLAPQPSTKETIAAAAAAKATIQEAGS